VLTACSGRGSDDDVIGMAWVGARIFSGSNALKIVSITLSSEFIFFAFSWLLFELRRSIANVQYPNVQYNDFLTSVRLSVIK